MRLHGCGFSDISSRLGPISGKPNIPLALKIFPPLFLNDPWALGIDRSCVVHASFRTGSHYSGF